jgi:hypothetical protein
MPEVQAEYFKELSNNLDNGITEEKVEFGTEHDIRVPCTQEVSGAIIKLKNHRPPGEDSNQA